MSTHDDCANWGLTWGQCARYHGRLARYYGRLAVAQAARSRRLSRVASRLALAVLALQVVAFVALIFA